MIKSQNFQLSTLLKFFYTFVGVGQNILLFGFLSGVCSKGHALFNSDLNYTGETFTWLNLTLLLGSVWVYYHGATKQTFLLATILKLLSAGMLLIAMVAALNSVKVICYHLFGALQGLGLGLGGISIYGVLSVIPDAGTFVAQGELVGNVTAIALMCYLNYFLSHKSEHNGFYIAIYIVFCVIVSEMSNLIFLSYSHQDVWKSDTLALRATKQKADTNSLIIEDPEERETLLGRSRTIDKPLLIHYFSIVPYLFAILGLSTLRFALIPTIMVLKWNQKNLLFIFLLFHSSECLSRLFYTYSYTKKHAVSAYMFFAIFVLLSIFSIIMGIFHNKFLTHPFLKNGVILSLGFSYMFAYHTLFAEAIENANKTIKSVTARYIIITFMIGMNIGGLIGNYALPALIN